MHALQPGENLVGRRPDNHLVLEDVTVARRHCRVTLSEDGLRVVDLGSHCGLWINHQRASDRRGGHPLEPGDRLEVGGVELLVGLPPGEATVEWVRETFAGAGLPEPHVPPPLAARLTCWGPWTFGTRRVDGVYGLVPELLGELGSGRVDDYLVLGQGGHGVNSYSICYYLVQGALALFLEVGWGGAYMDGRRRTEEVTACLEAAARLARLGAWGDPGGGLLVVHASERASWWRRPGEPLAGDRNAANPEEALRLAFRWLAGR